MAYKGVFIVGCPRSGTTLLQSLIGCSPLVATFKETRLFTRTTALRAGRYWPVRTLRAEVARFAEENDLSDLTEIVSPITVPTVKQRTARLFQVLNAAAADRGRSIWLEKTPRHLRYIPLIEDVARANGLRFAFVHIVRDGVPNIASLVKASQTWQTVYSPQTALVRWQEDLALARSHLGREDHYFVCYEDLVVDSQFEAQRLARALELPLTADDLGNRGKLAESVIRPDEAWKKLNTGPIKMTGNTSSYLPQETLTTLAAQVDSRDYDLIRSAIR